jgi:hypothetical protein
MFYFIITKNHTLIYEASRDFASREKCGAAIKRLKTLWDIKILTGLTHLAKPSTLR